MNSLYLFSFFCLLSHSMASANYLPFNIDGFPFNQTTLSPSSDGQIKEKENLQELERKEKKIQKRELFPDVTISHEIPSIFIKGEVFMVEGKVNLSRLTGLSKGDHYLVTIVFMNIKSSEKLIHLVELPKNQDEFKTQVYFKQIGKYFLGIFIGESGPVLPKIYEIVEDKEIQNLPVSPNSSLFEPRDVQLQVKDNDFFIKWENQLSLTKIEFVQDRPKERITFIVSNDRGFFKVPFAAFKNFSQTETEIRIMHAESKGIGAYERNSEYYSEWKKRINVTGHQFGQIKKQYISINEPLPSMLEVNDTIRIIGESKEKMKEKAIIIEPGNFIKEEPLFNTQGKNIISHKYLFEVQQSAIKEGVYIIQINHQKGYALLNIPIYVGDKYPLLPDYHDLLPLRSLPHSNPLIPLTLHSQRIFLLNLINEKRKQFGVPAVKLDDNLNRLAQAHSKDMSQKHYASHTNFEGEGSAKRGRKFGIYTPIGQNIAVNGDIQYAQYRLNRSPIHLKNTIKEDWRRVGIGIALGSNHLYYITQEFSTDIRELNSAEIKRLKEKLVVGMQKESLKPLIENQKLSKETISWHKRYGIEKTNELKKIIKKNSISKAAILLTTVPYTERFVELLKDEGYLADKGKYNYGLSLEVKKGLMEIIVIFY